jgi:hypothetical protein
MLNWVSGLTPEGRLDDAVSQIETAKGSSESAQPRGVAQIRRPSRISRLERAAGCGIIGAQRTSIAHLHRPWRASVPRSLDKTNKSMGVCT